MNDWQSKRFRDLGGYAHRIPAGSAIMENYDAIADNPDFGPVAAMEYLCSSDARANTTNLAARIAGGPGIVNLFTPPFGKGSALQTQYGMPADFEPPYVSVSNERDGSQKLWLGVPSGKRRDWFTDADKRPSMTLPVKA